MDTVASVDVVELDVRPDLAAGRDPFSRIMGAARSLPAGGSVVIVAPFEPDPLYAVLGRMGFTHESQPLGDGSWRVTFKRNADA
jgi:uncharacterized protein (DUF2249 family)